MWLLIKPRRRSWAWWGIFLFALLMIAVYVFFELLDVDGSQLTDVSTRAVIAAEAATAEADRLVRADIFLFAALLHLGLSHISLSDLRHLSRVPAFRRARLHRGLPRRNPHRKLARTNLSIADPA